VTTSSFGDQFKFKEGSKKVAKHTYSDEDSLQLVGLVVKHGIHPIPRELLKYEYNFIQLEGQMATLVNLGPKWDNAWKKFNNDYFKKNVPGALLLRNGKVYRYSGPRNNWNHYYKGLEAVARFM